MYKVTMQYAHHTHDQSDVLDERYSGNGIDLFEAIDWTDQAEEAATKQKVAPTISFESEDWLLWLSVCGQGQTIEFVSECMFPGTISLLFGLIRRKGIVNLHTNTFSREQAKNAIGLFFSESTVQLEHLYKNA